ncbi:MAG: hypothetical protein QM703_14700 [Gemmatales bacterium]
MTLLPTGLLDQQAFQILVTYQEKFPFGRQTGNDCQDGDEKDWQQHETQDVSCI